MEPTRRVDIKIKHTDWYGFDHEAVRKQFPGNPDFRNYMPLRDNAGKDFVGAVYYVGLPDRKKGNKPYLILLKQKGQLFVTGMSRFRMNKFRMVSGLLCQECGTAVYSISRHHFNMCDCRNAVFADGGLDYFRAGAKRMMYANTVQIDLLTNKVTIVK